MPTNESRAGSTLGRRRRLYPWQGNLCPYTLSYRRRGQLPESQNGLMTMYPEAPITENMVEFKAKEILFLDKSAEMEAKVDSGKGMMLLAEMAKKQYYEYFGQVLWIDLNLDSKNDTHTSSGEVERVRGLCNTQREIEFGWVSHQIGSLDAQHSTRTIGYGNGSGISSERGDCHADRTVSVGHLPE